MIIFERYGFHFTRTALTTSTGENLYLVVKMKGRSSVASPRLSVWEYREEEYVSFIQEKQIKAAYVILDDFSFLSKCPSIEMLTVQPSYQAPNHISFEPIYQMPELIALEPNTVYGVNDQYWSEFDCSKLISASQLRWFGGSCKKKSIKNIASLTGLKSLCLSSYNENDLCDAVGSPSLDTLDLLLCRIRSLNGIHISKGLKVVKLANCYLLEDINELYESRENLQGLVIDSCKKIRDYSVLAELKNLTRLSIINSGPIPTLSFLDQLPNLKTLILSCDIEDGDLSYCDRLEHVSIYPNKRHFNRKNEDFPKKKRPDVILGDEEIDEWRQHVLR